MRYVAWSTWFGSITASAETIAAKQRWVLCHPLPSADVGSERTIVATDLVRNYRSMSVMSRPALRILCAKCAVLDALASVGQV
jgi:hypothetical protein